MSFIGKFGYRKRPFCRCMMGDIGCKQKTRVTNGNIASFFKRKREEEAQKDIENVVIEAKETLEATAPTTWSDNTTALLLDSEDQLCSLSIKKV